MLRDPLFHSRRSRAVVLGQGQEAELQALVEACDDFWMLISGERPHPDEGRTLLEELPPGKEHHDKLVVGLYAGDELFGVLDLIRDYPSVGIWYVGLLLLHPKRRKDGLGKEIVIAVERWVQQQGGHALELVVQQQNLSALSFWKKNGFTEVGLKQQTLGVRLNTVVSMQRSLS